MAIQGSCVCGSVRYEIEDPFTLMMHCHCSMCRKHHGAPFVTFTAAALEGFRWVSGENAVAHYASSPNGKRSFCTVCGSVAPTLMAEAGLAVVPAGTLDGDPGIRLRAHMFVGSKASWYTISDSLPQHETYPPDFGDATPVQRPLVAAEPGKTPGSCLCGDVAYEITKTAVAMYQCHCSRCRKSRGAAFCRQCGGATPRVSVERGTVLVPAGALDTDPGMRPMAHIFVESKAPWSSEAVNISTAWL